MNSIILFLKAVIMGIVEGVTEFLPVSSTGHLILFGHLIQFDQYGDYSKLFEIVIQLGAILAIVVLYRKKIWDSIKSLFHGGYGLHMWVAILIAFVPSGIVGVLFNHQIENVMMAPIPVAFALIVGAVFMLIMEALFRNNNKTRRIDDVGFGQALAIGLFQCLSVLWPGFSRSASTIMGGWAVGLSTVAAAEFSFFLAIPSMVGASGYELVKSRMAMTSPQLVALLIGFVVSFLVALVVVKKFIDYLKHKPMRVFAVYRLIVGGFILVLALFGVPLITK